MPLMHAILCGPQITQGITKALVYPSCVDIPLGKLMMSPDRDFLLRPFQVTGLALVS
jgi:hypothetical protein